MKKLSLLIQIALLVAFCFQLALGENERLEKEKKQKVLRRKCRYVSFLCNLCCANYPYRTLWIVGNIPTFLYCGALDQSRILPNKESHLDFTRKTNGDVKRRRILTERL